MDFKRKFVLMVRNIDYTTEMKPGFYSTPFSFQVVLSLLIGKREKMY